MTSGQYISGAAHIGLIAWLLFGGGFDAEPLPFESADVSIVTGEEYAALVAAADAPSAQAALEQPAPPAEEQGAPMAPGARAAPPARPARPDPAEAAPAEEAPEAPDISVPQADVADDDPVVPPSPDIALPEPSMPDPSPDAAPAQAPRVAPDAVARPDPDAAVDDIVQEAVRPDVRPEAPAPDPAREATAPEATAPRIVTEAEESRRAPPPDIRPQPRPERRIAEPAPEPAPPPDPTPQPEPEPEPTPSAQDDAVAAALAEALGGADGDETRPSGPPLTAGERDALRVAVSSCWNVGSLSSDALRVTVVVGVGMNPDGTPVAGSIRLISASGGSGGAADQAFEAARRAILRCGARGFDLPADKYDRWQDIEMTFDPEKMRRL